MRLKKFLALALIVTLFFTLMPAESLAAAITQDAGETNEETNDVDDEGDLNDIEDVIASSEDDINSTAIVDSDETTDSTAESETNANVSGQEDSEEQQVDSSVVEYIYIESPTLYTPDTQNIVIGLSEDITNIDSAKLTYQYDNSGSSYVVDSASIIDNTILFSIDFDGESESGIYTITGITYTIEDVIYSVLLENTDTEYTKFGVNEEYSNSINDDSTDDISLSDIETEILIIDEDGKTTSVDSIEEAIAAAQEETQSAAPARARMSAAPAAASSNIVVVLDPGHCATHPGASANGLKEHELNLKIAQYCKAELEEYQGVTVYMTRTTNACAYPGSTSDECLTNRVPWAKTKGATIFVSIHCNNYITSNVNGAEVYYPNSNYNTSSLGNSGKALAQKIQNQLVALGLTNRGIKLDNSTRYFYPDGSPKDGLAVIRQSKDAGFPGILVEHGFLSGSSDSTFLQSESNIKKLGIADATGIAEYFGLTKTKTATLLSTPILSNTGNTDQTQFTLTAKNVILSTDIKEVSFAVWSEINGQDDLKWYSGSMNSSAIWASTASINNHKTEGKYLVHAYAKATNGAEVFLGQSTFTVQGSSLSSVNVTNINDANGTFDVIIKGVKSISGIKQVTVPIWSATDQSDIYWYIATLQSDGNYKVSVNNSKHNYNYGSFNIHVYLTDGNGIYKFCGSNTAKLTIPTASLSTSGNSSESSYTLTADNVVLAGGVKEVTFAVWSESGGQDDLVWYAGSKNTSGSWTATASINKHKTAGKYFVHVYAAASNGSQKFIGQTTFTVQGPTLSTVNVTNKNAEKGTFDVIVNGVTSKSGIKNVVVPVWSAANQSDIVWYNATKQSDGTYKISVDISKHNYNYGNYNIHVYITDENGVYKFCGNNTVQVPIPEASLSTTGNSAESAYTLTADNVALAGGVKEVTFAVWSESGGQDDIVWYSGSKNSSGSWTATASISKHKTAGKYFVHIYATATNGSQKFIGQTTFTVQGPTLSTVNVTNKNAEKGTFDVIINGVTSKSGIKNVVVPVWSEANQSDIIWYTATKQSDGTYKISIDISKHNYNYGSYNIHVYITDENGIFKFCGNNTETFTMPVGTLSASGNANESEYVLTAQGITLAGGIKSVTFAVWSESGGQDDIVWYTGSKNSSGNWTATASIGKHKTAGKYFVHIYATAANGSQKFIGQTTFTVQGPSLKSISVTNKDTATGTFDVIISGASSPSEIKNVSVPIWSASNQSDVKWYTATKQNNGTYKVSIYTSNHNYYTGDYNIHVYLTDGNGIYKFAGGITEKITSNAKSYYSIMGETSVSKAQMVSLFKASRQPYPSAVLSSNGAATIEEFCQIYIEEAKAEGVKAEVAFAQSMNETGYLQFGGSVNIKQNNFGGLGATSATTPGLSFANVREGVRAQIQHLKAYASTAPLNNPCVDPRFNFVTRGSAIYVEWLGISENPNGKGWASAIEYGNKIVILIQKTKTY